MTRALSNDLRQRVVASVLSGETCRQVAARFGIAVSPVVKWRLRPPNMARKSFGGDLPPRGTKLQMDDLTKI